MKIYGDEPRYFAPRLSDEDARYLRINGNGSRYFVPRLSDVDESDLKVIGDRHPLVAQDVSRPLLDVDSISQCQNDIELTSEGYHSMLCAPRVVILQCCQVIAINVFILYFFKLLFFNRKEYLKMKNWLLKC